ncbi:MAG: SseB family protein [Dactylosporangium sp.]|nr:SseB family protein [Dactylosporangium sp.]NNJ62110.1 SseB family protein [Dactylosporangium sp.]
MAGSAWTPANPHETAMLAAVKTGDQRMYLAALAAAPLLLPVSEEAAKGHEPMRWATGVVEGVTFLLAFTSTRAIAASMPERNVRYRVMRFVDLVAEWPDPAWRLALNPQLPITVHLDAPTLHRIRDAVPDAVKANTPTPAEAILWSALLSDDLGAFMATLIRHTLLIPLRPDGGPSRDPTDPEFPWVYGTGKDGQRVIPVFTSERLLRQTLKNSDDFIELDLLAIAEAWPEGGLAMAVNPNTPLAAVLAPEQVRGLAGLAGEIQAAAEAALAERQEQETQATTVRLLSGEDPFDPAPAGWEPDIEQPDDAPVLAEPLMLQLAIPLPYLAAYLEQDYDRAAGLVHPRRAVGTESPLSLYRRLGLLGEGSPFTASDAWVAVLRWLPDEDTPASWGRGEPRMESLTVPHDAEIHRIHANQVEDRIARYDAGEGRWLPLRDA